MRPYQMHIKFNLLFFVYSISLTCRTYQASTIVVTAGSRVSPTSTNQTSSSYATQDSTDDPTNDKDLNAAGASPSIDLVVKNGTPGYHSEYMPDSQLRLHSYNVSDFTGSSSNSSTDDLSTSDSSLLTRAISPKMDNDENLVDVGEPSEPEEDPYGLVEGSSLSEQRAVRELTKILSRGLAGVTDHVGVERLENWKQQQKYRKKVKDERARLFEDILMAAIESHPDKSERYKTKRTKLRTSDELIQNRSVPIVGNYINNLDPELAQDAETIVQNLQGIASVFGGSGGSEDSTSGGRDYDKPNSEESSDAEKVTPSRPILRQFNKIKRQLSNRRKQFDQIKKIFNQDYTTAQNSEGYQQNRHTKDSNYREEDEFTIVDDYSHHKPLNRRSPPMSSRNHKLEQLSNYLLENPAALGSALAELSSSSSTSVKHSVRQSPYVGALHHHANGRGFSRRYRESVNSVDEDSDDVTRKPSRQDSSTSIGVRDVGPEVDKSLPRVHEQTSHVASHQTPAPIQPTPSPMMSTAETMLLNSLKERQLMNLVRLETVLAERQQATATGRPVTAAGALKNINSMPNNAATNSTYNNPNGRAQESIRNQKQSTKQEELHHFVVVNPDPASTKPEDYGSDLNSLNIDPYDAAALDQSRSAPKLNRFKDWTDVSQSETRSSIVKDQASGIGHRSGMETNKFNQALSRPEVTDKRPSLKSNHGHSKEFSARPEHRVVTNVLSNDISNYPSDQSPMEERIEENLDDDDTSRLSSHEENVVDEDVPEGVYVKLDRIALGSETRSGPVDYFSAYKNEMKSTKRPRKQSHQQVLESKRSTRKQQPKIEEAEEEGDEGGAAMWAR